MEVSRKIERIELEDQQLEDVVAACAVPIALRA